jgi:hypothetical protein
MAIFTTAPGIDELTGKFSQKDRIVMRKKQFKYPNGKIFGCGPKEAFARDKRDYKRSPRTEAEEVQHARWTAVCQEASRIEQLHPFGSKPRNDVLTKERLRSLFFRCIFPPYSMRVCLYYPGNFIE